MLAFHFAFLVTVTLAFLRVAVVACGSIVRSSTGSPKVFRPMISSASVLARVDVCRARVGRAGRTVFSLVVGFPERDGQAADAASAYTQVKLETAPRLFKNSKVRMSRRMDTSSTTQMSEIIGKH